MNRIKLYRWSLILLAVYCIILLYLTMVLPSDAEVPMHWNAEGAIDAYYSWQGASLFGVGINFGIFLLIYLMPLYSPKYRKSEARFERILPGLSFVLILFFSLISLYSFAIALYGNVMPINFIFILIGLLFIVLGNILPKVPRNFFIGIKTPWTLSDPDNWYKTHRLGAYLFVAGGLVMIIKGLVLLDKQSFQTVTTIIAIALLLYPLLYSFLLYRKQNS